MPHLCIIIVGEAQALLKNPKKVSDIDPLSIAGIFAAGQLLFAP